MTIKTFVITNTRVCETDHFTLEGLPLLFGDIMPKNGIRPTIPNRTIIEKQTNLRPG